MKYSIITLVTSTIFTLLFFISLLGENHHIDGLISNHISKLEKANFSSECVPIRINQKTNNELSCNQNSFILLVSLLKRFDLFTAENYKVEITRDVFWIPFYSDDVVKVSLSLINPKIDETGMFDEYQYLPNIFIVKRKNSSWKLQEVSITDPDLISIFNETKEEVNFDKYIEKTQHGYKFNNVEVNIKTITDVDKLLLKFNLQKANSALN